MSTSQLAAFHRSRPAACRQAVAFEWTKLAGVRSTWISLAVALAATLGFSWLIGASARASGENGYDSFMPAPEIAFSSLQVSQLLLVVVAALCITAEYASGTITTTLQSVPVRGRLLGAKAMVLAALGFATGVVLVVVGTAIAAPSAGDYGLFTAGGFLAAAVGAGGYLALLAVMMLGTGTLLRSTAGTITTAFILLFALPQLLPLFRLDWLRQAADYLPTSAGLVLGSSGPGPYGVGTALLVLCLWTGSLLAAGYLSLVRRDA
ncbi:MAG TPA: ABC transporter permease [Arthrobacter sp.]|nr:ABC transporter permease [Arthrobacter sp.]